MFDFGRLKTNRTHREIKQVNQVEQTNALEILKPGSTKFALLVFA